MYKNSETKKDGSKQHENKVCDICLHKASSPAIALAVKHCPECDQNYCNDCLQTHAIISASSSHQLQCIDPPSSHLKCYHSNQQWYCSAEKDFCCAECKDSIHCRCDVLSCTKILEKQDHLMEQNQKLLQRFVKMKYKMEEETKATQKKERDWMERLNIEISKMNQAKEELEEQIKLKVDYVKCHMKKSREIVDKKLSDLQNAINEIEKDKQAMGKQTLDETKRLQLINKLEENLETFRPLLSADTKDSHIAFLKANCAFESQHYYEEIMNKFKETIASINKIYGEIQKHIIPSDRNIAARSDTEETSVKSLIYGVEETNLKTRYAPTTSISEDKDQTKRLSELPSREIINAEGSTNEEKPYNSESDAVTMTVNLQEKRMMDELTDATQKPGAVKELGIQSQCQMNVKIDNDETTCGITGIAVLESGCYLLADFMNSRLKIFAPCGKYICHLDCDGKPRDIAKMAKNRFLITFPMNELVRIVEVQEDLEENQRKIVNVKDIKTHARCCGVAYQNEKIYVATQLPHQILIMFPDGKNDRIIVGDNMFERATYIAVEPTISMVYISDPNRMFVIGINDHMKKKFEYNVQQPHAVACAGNGRIFVTDWSLDIGTIHLVDRDGTQIGYVELPNCQCPQKIVYQRDVNTLLVSNWSDNQLMTVRLKPF